MAGDAVEVFFSYSHKDEALREQLGAHLKHLERERIISGWHDRKIMPGSDWAGDINASLSKADIVLLLVSADFLASDYCWDVEIQKALERHDAGEATVIPVILRPVDWSSTPFARLQALPKNAQPVATWNPLTWRLWILLREFGTRRRSWWRLVGNGRRRVASRRRCKTIVKN